MSSGEENKTKQQQKPRQKPREGEGHGQTQLGRSGGGRPMARLVLRWTVPAPVLGCSPHLHVPSLWDLSALSPARHRFGFGRRCGRRRALSAFPLSAEGARVWVPFLSFPLAGQGLQAQRGHIASGRQSRGWAQTAWLQPCLRQLCPAAHPAARTQASPAPLHPQAPSFSARASWLQPHRDKCRLLAQCSANPEPGSLFGP